MHRAEWYPAAMAASSPLYSELEFFVRSEGGEVTAVHVGSCTNDGVPKNSYEPYGFPGSGGGSTGRAFRVGASAPVVG